MNAAKATLRRVIARRDTRRYHSQDPTLTAVRASLLKPAPDEPVWTERVEGRRAALEGSSATVSFEAGDPAWWKEMIARSGDPQPPRLEGATVTRHVAEITRQTSKPPRWGRAFYRLVCALAPKESLELGTSVGMSASYIGAGLARNGAGRLVTIEGLAEVSAIARDGFAELGVADRVTPVVGRFDDVLPDVLVDLGALDLAFIDGNHQYEPTMRYFEAALSCARPSALLIFDDVSYWHGAMERAWREIREHPRVTGSLTAEGVGFAVVDGTPDGHHTIKRISP